MKLLEIFKKQIAEMGDLKRVWLTTFNLDISFVETWVLPAVLGMDVPASRMDYEGLQRALNESGIDFRIYCDPRMMAKDKPKRTSIAVYPVSVRKLAQGEDSYLDKDRGLFHPKVFYLEDHNRKIIVGAGSANLTLRGWGRNQEAIVFRCVASNTQYQQVKQFFTSIDNSLNKEAFFPIRRKFLGDDHDWSFIHSLDGVTLLDKLKQGVELKTLSVWSPYLAADLAGFIGRLGPELHVELVPDLVEGSYIRTRWSESIQELITSKALTLHDSPAPKDDRALMTHAKLWLAKSSKSTQLAVGSWNFTSPGCSSLKEKNWNVEAGIVHPVSRNITICGKEWDDVNKEDFASEALLKEEELELGELPPFDLTVIFDWTRCEYQIVGQWFSGKPESGYHLILPGINGSNELVWKANGKVLKSPQQLAVLKSDAVLDNPFYTLRRAGKTDWQGMIVETGTEHRRALSFTSLDDLLNSYLSSADPGLSDRLMLRSVGAQDEVQSEVEAEIVRLEVTSYFRLFQAIQQRRNWLEEVEDGTLLYRRLFSEPGCLLELAEIARERAKQLTHPVFNWFLAQEVNSLAALAIKRVKSIRRKQGAEAIFVAAHLWESLQVAIPPLTSDAASLRYLAAIREDCSYGE
ncbi:hypothetical protein [Lelliottia amnigena]|uniref:hypothetical protein n=1 Tax=Lelliottia amnigena TaxID=61646 RepID=UPI0019561A9B|nr:hypothetical protein [Lelliottia amnigena]MBM7355904.1 hypothetical protein [Lelliottia amnigena]WSO18216.1 hypothetical protein VUJ45_14095 [Lelliottia amnigena]